MAQPGQHIWPWNTSFGFYVSKLNSKCGLGKETSTTWDQKKKSNFKNV